MPTRLRLAPTLLAGVAAALAATGAWAWGASGHRWIGEAAMAALPADTPAFLRTAAAQRTVGELAREPDRWKGSGQPHDADRDPGHFIDLDDAGHVMSPAGPALAELPPNHAAYDAALTRVGLDGGKAGFLPYEIEGGYQQLVRDFTLWRMETALLKRTNLKPAERAWITADLAERQQLTLRDLGVWAHYVGDASQPLHVSIHYNGWGRDLPNPRGYTTDPIHGPFEGAFVHDNLSLAAVRGAMTPLAPCADAIGACTVRYLQATLARTEPLYQLWGEGGFKPGDPRGRAFALERVSAGASELRDLVIKAWNASADGTLGRPPSRVSVRDVLSGRPIPWDELYGDD